jgi:two-component system, NarL family, response regulator DesR
VVKRVYVVDDSALIRERLVDILSGIPEVQLVGQSANAYEALAMIRKTRPDVVILDIQMPGRSGIALLKDIKRDTPTTRVIVFTNYAYPQYQRQCMQLGAEYFLSKVSEFERLSALLKSMDDPEHPAQGSNQEG